MKGEDLLNYVWSHQPDGYRFVVLRKGKLWADSPVPPTTPSIIMPEKLMQAKDGDLYWCPNVFSERERRKRSCLPSRVMYQDLDEVHPSECPIQPEVYWETSPGRWQGLWILDGLMEPEEFSAYNRALNRACQADPGTWNLTRLLRVPGSWNAKRDCRVGSATVRKSLPAVA